jgi:hypothetical protein
MNRTSNYALLDYACRYWADHLRQSEFCSSIDEETTRLLDWFLNSKSETGQYISWQQMYHHDIKYYCPSRPPLYYAIEFRINALVLLLLVVIRLTCLMHVIYARHAYMLPTLQPKKNQASINQQRIRIATQ